MTNSLLILSGLSPKSRESDGDFAEHVLPGGDRARKRGPAIPYERQLSSGIPAQTHSLLELIERLREEFPGLSPHAVVRCVSIVAHHPSATALHVDALLRHTERIARARLTHLNELPAQPAGRPTILTIPQPRSSDMATAGNLVAST
jgi:hypothetical protein